MLRGSVFGAAAAVVGSAGRKSQAATSEPVDLLLVLAIDASGSLSDARITMQRLGHAGAIMSAEFLMAVRSGPYGRVALAAIEWSNHDRQGLVAPWTVIEDAATAALFAQQLLRAPRPIPGYTSISGAIDFASGLMATAPHAAPRRVIDVSGNGSNNDGRSVAAARDDAVAVGITINGLPIPDVETGLDEYYAAEVIGGARAFVAVARDATSFPQILLRKLVAEVAATPTGAGLG